ncbi:MAG: ABC transporter ATP-binding protein [Chloroflexota bacterium]
MPKTPFAAQQSYTQTSSDSIGLPFSGAHYTHTSPQQRAASAITSVDPVLTTTGLTKKFGNTTVVDNVDLTIYPGEVFGLLGPNGAGKTTIIAMLLGLVHPTSGTRAIYGHDVDTHRTEALQHVGAMIEAPSFYPYLSGWDNLKVLSAPRGAISNERIYEVLEIVGLAERAGDRYRTYSLGMKQRLAIALTLIHDPRILILDEPTNGLDPRGIVDIRSLIERLAQQGKTVILCSHLMHEVEQVCHRLAIIRQGQIITQGTVQDIVGQRDLETLFLELTEEEL